MLAEFTSAKNAATVIFSSADVTEGDSYSIVSNGQTLGTATAGEGGAGGMGAGPGGSGNGQQGMNPGGPRGGNDGFGPGTRPDQGETPES